MKSLVMLACAMIGYPLFAAEPLRIASDGQALLPIRLAPTASPESRAAGEALARHLHTISGGTFAVESGESRKGAILLGTDAEWPGILKAGEGIAHREDYCLRLADDGALLVIGRTPLALENALWDLLYRLGFRQYFPGRHWEIWPGKKDLAIAVDVDEQPDYLTRRIFMGGGEWPDSAREANALWRRRNRMVSGFTLETQHAYGDIIRRHPDHFAAHPEDLLQNGKLDASRPTAREIALSEALRQLSQNARQDSVSMDPSDGGGWRADSPLGSPSDQAVTLANYVAEGIQERFPGRKVGIYAYNEHSRPPEIEVSPHVIISVATAFRVGGMEVPDLMKAWRAKGARELGIREYISVWGWERDLPGRALATRPSALAESIAQYHGLGARYWTSEASNSWMPNGPGQWIASRILWDTSESSRVPELLEEFYRLSYGNAARPMKTFFQRYIFDDGKPLLSEDLVGRMYRTLSEALEQAGGDEAVRARIFDAAVYTRYVDLTLVYRSSDGPARQQAYEELLKFAWQARETRMVNTRAVFNLPKRDQRLTAPGEWKHAGQIPALQEAGLVDAEALLHTMRERIAEIRLMEFEAVAFSQELEPAPLPTNAPAGSGEPITLRGLNRLHLYADDAESGFSFEIRGGLIYGSRGPVRLRLFSPENPMVNEPVAEVEVVADKTTQSIHLQSPYKGMHTLEINDGNDKTALVWPAGQRVAFPLAPEESTRFDGRYTLLFYVPEGTREVGGYSNDAKGKMVLPGGREAYDFAAMKGPGYFTVPVAPEDAGQWWSLRSVSGEKLLMTVPPLGVRSAAEGLLPREALKH